MIVKQALSQVDGWSIRRRPQRVLSFLQWFDVFIAFPTAGAYRSRNTPWDIIFAYFDVFRWIEITLESLDSILKTFVIDFTAITAVTVRKTRAIINPTVRELAVLWSTTEFATKNYTWIPPEPMALPNFELR